MSLAHVHQRAMNCLSLPRCLTSWTFVLVKKAVYPRSRQQKAWLEEFSAKAQPNLQQLLGLVCTSTRNALALQQS
eukprot:CAMPEP_0197696486 /NCGR_PEP_ID=MMETSP1338-20131121/116680_1 /TAXON_ID=43686 ORGANISM="Pelagodinium beii, Strain RCC1491" /NCGR_SAMPLE_ID=MMETSP1338 /ASSEMBLY_ACC=CAM_ASM_000754 /LENGTH=74 /DNA_ID=CAMNT_0043279607 /DNA_START=115 /DNA_END=340 /DNA_ORIENTATION=+